MNKKRQFFHVGGRVPLDNEAYIKRPADDQLYNLIKHGEFCYLLTSRQMGKSSLYARVAEKLKQDGYKCAYIDLSGIGTGNTTPDQWYNSIIYRLATDLGLDFKMTSWIGEKRAFTPNTRLIDFVDNVMLKRIKGNIVVFIDEIDAVLGLDKSKFNTDDFFAFIRALYNSREENEDYQRLNFTILGVAAPADLINDPERTPFNIGRGIKIENLRFEDSHQLIIGFEHIEADKLALLEEIFAWSGGQPVITQQLCREIALNENRVTNIKATVRKYVDKNYLSEGQEHSDHNLYHIKERILRIKDEGYRVKMLSLYRRILQGEKIKENSTSNSQLFLRLSGIIVVRNGYLVPGNRIYREKFDEEWVDYFLTEYTIPYKKQYNIWITRNKQDRDLLSGAALQDANSWIIDKERPIGEIDFIIQSRKTEFKRIKELEEKYQRKAEKEKVLAIEVAEKSKRLALMEAAESRRRLNRSILTIAFFALIASGATLFSYYSYQEREMTNLLNEQLIIANDSLILTQELLENLADNLRDTALIAFLSQEEAEKAKARADSAFFRERSITDSLVVQSAKTETQRLRAEKSSALAAQRNVELERLTDSLLLKEKALNISFENIVGTRDSLERYKAYIEAKVLSFNSIRLAPFDNNKVEFATKAYESLKNSKFFNYSDTAIVTEAMYEAVKSKLGPNFNTYVSFDLIAQDNSNQYIQNLIINKTDNSFFINNYYGVIHALKPDANWDATQKPNLETRFSINDEIAGSVYYNDMTISPDYKNIITGDKNGYLYFFQASDGDFEHNFIKRSAYGTSEILNLADAGDNTSFWCYAQGETKITKLTYLGEPIDSIQIGVHSIVEMDLSPDGTLLAYCDEVGNYTIRNLQNKESASIPLKVSKIERASKIKLVPMQDDYLLVVGNENGDIRLLEYRNGQLNPYLKQLTNSLHSGQISDIIFDPLNQFLGIGSLEGSLSIWDLSKLNSLDSEVLRHSYYFNDMGEWITSMIFLKEGNTTFVLAGSKSSKLKYYCLDIEKYYKFLKPSK